MKLILLLTLLALSSCKLEDEALAKVDSSLSSITCVSAQSVTTKYVGVSKVFADGARISFNYEGKRYTVINYQCTFIDS